MKDLLMTSLQETGYMSVVGLALDEVEEIVSDLGLEKNEVMFTQDGMIGVVKNGKTLRA